MTRITVHFQGGRPVGFTAKGHSGYADKGEDIVCAAISALTETAYLGVTELAKADAEAVQKDGELRLMLKPEVSGLSREKAELILETMLLGLRSIEENYSDYLKILKREVKA
ncbi:MAG: ribosomal-processing cysteine protease Prp [Clostridiales bacterium]|nr:ribosomal-processing cysteine protease Prp [Clostridiales bacterium]